MSAPATIRFHPSAATTAPSASSSRPWSPSDRDRLIFQWIKFDGHTQSWVAEQLDMNQSTVSRIVERYERWIARGGPRRQGGLSTDERLRSQRWMTYERNEWILTSALRIAGEMERAIDTSKSTITRDASSPSGESEIRTEHKVLDRSGIAARFLRLAYRVNMDQLKLAEQEPLPDLEPLTIDDADDFEPAGANPHAEASVSHADAQGTHYEEAHVDDSRSTESPGASLPLDETDQLQGAQCEAQCASPMHGVHNADQPESHSTAVLAATCDETTTPEKPSAPAYAVAKNTPPEAAESPPSLPVPCPPSSVLSDVAPVPSPPSPVPWLLTPALTPQVPVPQ